jgi:hypothetical protein
VSESSNAAGWIQTAGVGGFALLVLYLLRELRPILKAVSAELFEVRLIIAALLERERIRDARRRREESTQPTNRRQPKADTFGEEERTDIKTLIEIQRDAAVKRGVRPPRPGTHHDED